MIERKGKTILFSFLAILKRKTLYLSASLNPSVSAWSLYRNMIFLSFFLSFSFCHSSSFFFDFFWVIMYRFASVRSNRCCFKRQFSRWMNWYVQAIMVNIIWDDQKLVITLFVSFVFFGFIIINYIPCHVDNAIGRKNKKREREERIDLTLGIEMKEACDLTL